MKIHIGFLSDVPDSYLYSFSSFLESRGQPLLDLCLYVSSENYTAWTRPALAQILQWPHQWVIPHQLRNNAKIRSEHLGLSSLDIETASEEDGNSNTRGAGNIPKNLVTKPKETVKSMLGKTGHQHQFRLAAVTSDFLEPLQDLVQKNGSHSWVFGTDRASSLDCLILGYMSLANPPLPPPYKWLQNALSARYSELFQWTTNFRQECFGGPINTVDVLHASMTDLPSGQNKLPWRSSAPISAMNIGLTIFRATFDALPLVSTYRPDRIVRDSGDTAGASSALVKTTQYPTYNGLGLAGSALGAAIGYFLYMGAFSSSRRTHHDHVFCSRRNNTSQRDFGEAGRMLGLAAL